MKMSTWWPWTTTAKMQAALDEEEAYHDNALAALHEDLEERERQVAIHQQREDEIIVALGSLGILPSEIAETARKAMDTICASARIDARVRAELSKAKQDRDSYREHMRTQGREKNSAILGQMAAMKRASAIARFVEELESAGGVAEDGYVYLRAPVCYLKRAKEALHPLPEVKQ